MTRKYLITGGAGFIGSNFVRMLAEDDPEAIVVNLDLLTYAGVPATVEELDEYPNHRFVKGDIRDETLVDDVMSGVDMVIHFAAESHVDRSIAGPGPFVSTNVLGTAVLLDAAMRHEVDRFIHVSTDEVYGSVAAGFARETALLNPPPPYSSSKAGSVLPPLPSFPTYGYPVTATRSTNNSGPYQSPEKVT